MSSAPSEEDVIVAVISGMASLVGGSEEQERVFMRSARQMQLSEMDLQKFRAELLKIRSKSESARQRLQNGFGKTSTTQSPFLEIRILALDAYQRTLKSVSPQGATKLRERMAYLKERTKAVAQPQSAPR